MEKEKKKRAEPDGFYTSDRLFSLLAAISLINLLSLSLSPSLSLLSPSQYIFLLAPFSLSLFPLSVIRRPVFSSAHTYTHARAEIRRKDMVAKTGGRRDGTKSTFLDNSSGPLSVCTVGTRARIIYTCVCKYTKLFTVSIKTALTEELWPHELTVEFDAVGTHLNEFHLKLFAFLADITFLKLQHLSFFSYRVPIIKRVSVQACYVVVIMHDKQYSVKCTGIKRTLERVFYCATFSVSP